MQPKRWEKVIAFKLLTIIQPLFLFVVIPAYLFDTQFILELVYVHVFFTIIQVTYIGFLFLWRSSEEYFYSVRLLSVSTFPIWFLLQGVDIRNHAHLSHWTAIYFQIVVLQSFFVWEMQKKIYSE